MVTGAYFPEVSGGGLQARAAGACWAGQSGPATARVQYEPPKHCKPQLPCTPAWFIEPRSVRYLRKIDPGQRTHGAKALARSWLPCHRARLAAASLPPDQAALLETAEAVTSGLGER